jgi:hypothetical protein
VFLRYRLGLGQDNRMSAPGVHLFPITAYHQASLARPPSIAGMKVSATFDGGKHCSRVPAVPAGDGTLSVLLHPRLRGPAGNTGKVSLRTEAWDRVGSPVWARSKPLVCHAGNAAFHGGSWR